MAPAINAKIPSSTPTTVPATAPPPFFFFASSSFSAVVLDAAAGAVAGIGVAVAANDDCNAVRVGFNDDDKVNFAVAKVVTVAVAGATEDFRAVCVAVFGDVASPVVGGVDAAVAAVSVVSVVEVNVAVAVAVRVGIAVVPVVATHVYPSPGQLPAGTWPLGHSSKGSDSLLSTATYTSLPSFDLPAISSRHPFPLLTVKTS